MHPSPTETKYPWNFDQMMILQFTSIVLLLSTLGLASPLPASPGERYSLSERDTQFQLPSTVMLIAQTNEGNLGCINAYGHFTRSLIWCYPFRVFYTDGNNGNDGNLFGWDFCRLSSSMIDGATMECYNTAFTIMPQFWLRDGYMSIDGPTGTYFSINTWPSLNDTIGVPLTIGASGGYAQFQLYAKNTSA